jgi:flagellar protein FlaI
MATGHTAYGTMHADSTEAVIHRLESEPISIPRSLLEALDIVSIQIQTRIGERRVRRTKELVEVVGLDPHTREILTNEVFTWSPAHDEFEFSGVSYVLERIQIERNMSESDMKDEFDRRKRIIHWMVEKDIRALDEVGRIIATYYRNPDAVMALVDADAGIEQLHTMLVPVPTSDGPTEMLAVEPETEGPTNGPQ